MITQEEVKHIAKLARLGLTEKEIEKFQNELSPILDYIEKLNEVDTANIEPTSHSIKVENVMREDQVKKTKTESKRLMDLAPDKKDSYIKVKSILK